MLPEEIPYREVAHDEEDELWDPVSMSLGTVRDREWWGTPTDHKKELAELRRREAARARLGGFGFRPPGAAT